MPDADTTNHTSALVGMVVLIDADPPSLVGERGLYPPSGLGPPDHDTFRTRHRAISRFVREVTHGKAVVTVHTSQAYRLDFLRPPFVDAWRELLEAGADLALHPHEERDDGSPRYDEAHYILEVLDRVCAAARHANLPLKAFRSGFFAFNPSLPRWLGERGIHLDLSAAPRMLVPERGVDWQGVSGQAFRFLDADVLEVPLGWSGRAPDLDHEYLFNERQDLPGLIRVYEALLHQAREEGRPCLVNVLCHGYGLVDRRWRDQLVEFLEHVRARSGILLGVDEARHFYDRHLAHVPPNHVGPPGGC